jgi:peptidyl-prolyl cis-trans isomerase C
MTKSKELLLALSLIVIFLSGCCCQATSGAAKGEDAVVSINNYNITRAEFEKEFKDSTYGRTDTPESRKDFLESLVDRKLILQQAQKDGLDKERGFLKSIEKFWEQSLLKAALDKKTKEIAAKLSAAGMDAKRGEESRIMNDWIKELRAKAHIKVKGDILLKGKGL